MAKIAKTSISVKNGKLTYFLYKQEEFVEVDKETFEKALKSDRNPSNSSKST